MMARLRAPPTESAWMGSERHSLALLSWWLAERESLRLMMRAGLLDDADSHVSDLAGDALRAIDETEREHG